MNKFRVNRFLQNADNRASLRQRHSHQAETSALQDEQTGFIRHPSALPLLARKKWISRFAGKKERNNTRAGIMFSSSVYYPPGTSIELTIPVRNELEIFTGSVVLVKKYADHFDIGLCLHSVDDARRAETVEQICHIEAQQKEKKYRDGLVNLDPQRVASEWSAKFGTGRSLL